MYNIVQLRQEIAQFINVNDINGLKQFLEYNNIILRRLEFDYFNIEYENFVNKKFDFLIYAINNNASIDMIKFIINECQYETLNYGSVLNCPLFHAINNYNFKLANFLIENGADVNYRNINEFYEYEKNDLLSALIISKYSIKSNIDINNELRFSGLDKSIIYIIDNGFKSEDEFYIYSFISNNDLPLYILRHYINNKRNKYILNLLSYYQNRNPVQNNVLKDTINNIPPNDIFFITNDEYDLADFYRYFDEKMTFNFLRLCYNKLNEIKIIIENNENRLQIKTDLMNIIKFNNLDILKNYFLEKNINNSLINKFRKALKFDILMYAIESNISLEMLKFITEQYDSLNYFIVENINSKRINTPLSKAIRYEKFDIANLLLKNGANMNHEIYFAGQYYNIFEILGYSNLNYKILNYIFFHGDCSVPINIKMLIRYNLLNLVKFTFDTYFFSNKFILNFLFHYKNRIQLSTFKINEKLEYEKRKILNYDDLYYDSIFQIFEYNDFSILNILINNEYRGIRFIYNKIFNVCFSNFRLDDDRKYIIMNNISANTNLPVEQTLLNCLNNIKDVQVHVKNLMKKGSLRDLKNFLDMNHLDLMWLYDEDNNMLIYSLVNNISTDIIEYIFSQYLISVPFIPYENLSKSFIISFEKGYYKIANLLLNTQMNINLTLNYLDLSNLNSNKIIYFILDHGFDINKGWLNNYVIEDDETDFYYYDDDMDNYHYPYNDGDDDSDPYKYNCTRVLKLILNHYIFDNRFILNLLNLSKNRIEITDTQLENIIEYEKHKLKIDKSIYEKVFRTKNYESLEVLLDYYSDGKIIEHLNGSFNRSNGSINHDDDYNEFFKLKYSSNTLKKIIYKGRLDILKILVANGVKLNFKDNNNDTPLNYAIRTGNIEIIKYIIGCCHIPQNLTIHDFEFLIRNGRIDIIKLIIYNCYENEKEIMNQILFLSKKYNQMEIFDFIRM